MISQKLKYYKNQKSHGSVAILIAIIVLAVFALAAIIIGLALMTGLTGNNSGSETSGGLCANIPEPYNAIFQKAGDRWKVQPAFIAGIFYGGEHANSWPNANGPWASSKKGAQGPFQFMPATWEGHKQDGDGDGKMDVQNLSDSAFAAANLLANLGAGGNTTDENKLIEAAAQYNGGNNPPAYSYEIYAKNVLKAFDKFNCSAIAGSITEQAKKYAGIPYSQTVHCGPNTIGPVGVTALDCSGFVSRVYRDLGLLLKDTCYTTLSITTSPYLREISASDVRTGDLVVSDVHNNHKGDQAHVVIYVSGDVTKKFDTWQSGGNAPSDPSGGRVREVLRNAKPGQRYFRAKKSN